MTDVNLPPDLQSAIEAATKHIESNEQWLMIAGARWLYNELLKRGLVEFDQSAVKAAWKQICATTEYASIMHLVKWQHSQDAAQTAALKAEVEKCRACRSND